MDFFLLFENVAHFPPSLPLPRVRDALHASPSPQSHRCPDETSASVAITAAAAAVRATADHHRSRRDRYGQRYRPAGAPWTIAERHSRQTRRLRSPPEPRRWRRRQCGFPTTRPFFGFFADTPWFPLPLATSPLLPSFSVDPFSISPRQSLLDAREFHLIPYNYFSSGSCEPATPSAVKTGVSNTRITH